MKKKATLVQKLLILPLGVVAALLVLLAAGNALVTAWERGAHPAPGLLVDVNGKKIHVYSVGQGEPRVVLLSGLGTLSPVLDFAPLVRELQSRARVTVLEYPGYGWSSDTDEPRSTQASVEEIRQALKLASVEPPYVLVAHSISGLQALVYANRYPSEVAGIVGLENSLPEQLPYMHPMPQGINTSEFLRLSGIARAVLLLDPSLSGAPTDELTVQEARDFAMITNWNFGSHAIAAEGQHVLDDLRSTQGLSFPPNIPITLVLASQGVAKEAPGIPGEVWKSTHETKVLGNPDGKVVVLNGDHYIHHNNAKAVAALVFEVIENAARD